MDSTNAQRQARWRQRHKARIAANADELAQAQARIAELERALKQALESQSVINRAMGITQAPHDSVSPLPRTIAEWKALKAAVKAARKARRDFRAAAQQPPVDLDNERLLVERLLKDNERLKQANKEWHARLRYQKRHHEKEIERISKMREMPRIAYNVIAKCLHPDTRARATEEERYSACRMFIHFGTKSA